MGIFEDLMSETIALVDGLADALNTELNGSTDLLTTQLEPVIRTVQGMKYVTLYYFDKTVNNINKISRVLEDSISTVESGLTAFIDGIVQTLNGKIDIQGRQLEDAQKGFASFMEGFKVQMGIEMDDALKTVLEHTKNERQILANNTADLAASIMNSESFWGLFETTVDELW